MRARLVVIAVVCTAVAVPAATRAGDDCRTVGDRVGDARHLIPAAAAPDAGGAVDLTGFAVYPAGWGDLVVEVAVVDLAAGWHPAADARSYVVVWRDAYHRYRFEALDTRGVWSFAATRAPATVQPGSLEPEVQWPVTGIVDPEARSIRMIGSALLLGEGDRVLDRVQAWAEERRSAGTESVLRVGALLDDRAPDTAGGSTRIDLDEACAPAGPVGATPLCRVLTDAAGDARLGAWMEPAPAVDLTGMFVGSTQSGVVVELGVVETSPGEQTRPVYGARFDLDGRTLALQAAHDGAAWRFAVRDHLDDAWTAITGAVSHDRVRFEVPFGLVPRAGEGATMSSFAAYADEQLRLPGALGVPAGASDTAPDDASTAPPARHRLGGPCDPHA